MTSKLLLLEVCILVSSLLQALTNLPVYMRRSIDIRIHTHIYIHACMHT